MKSFFKKSFLGVLASTFPTITPYADIFMRFQPFTQKVTDVVDEVKSQKKSTHDSWSSELINTTN